MNLSSNPTEGTEGNEIDARKINSLIINWYTQHQRDLPWRRAGVSPWGVLVSEVMLQQTPVSRVEPIWTAWMERWPEPLDLAEASRADVLRHWDRMGYPRRALRLQESAQVICRDFDSQVPSRYEDLISLPGVGDYTAAAVMSFAFDQRAVVLDTNVRRVMARLDGEAEAASSSPTKVERAFAENLLPRVNSRAATWSVAIMELGSLVCTSRNPTCTTCPVAKHCKWLQSGQAPSQRTNRKTQKYLGTDRYVRGLIMSKLRSSKGSIELASIEALWPDQQQILRALDGLIADGLVETLSNKRFRFPN